MIAPFTTSPLGHRDTLVAGDLRMSARPFEGLLILRGAPGIVGPAVKKVLGAALPRAVGETGASKQATTAWLGPDEWLIITAAAQLAALQTALTTALDGTHYQLAEVSDYYTGIDLAGTPVRALLAKLMVFDLHPSVFRPVMAAATIAAKANVWLQVTGVEPAPDFTLYVRRSHADYLWCLLAEAGREWGLPPQAPDGKVPLYPAP